MSETASRRLFIFELVLFALPSLAVLLIYGLFLGGGGLVFAGGFLVGFVVSLFGTDGAMAPGAGDIAALTQAVGFYGAAGLIAIAGVVAQFKFMRVSHDFARYGRAALPALRGTLCRALLWAAVPLAVWAPFAIVLARSEDSGGWVIGAYFSGLLLFVPILHLWIEMRRLGRSAGEA